MELKEFWERASEILLGRSVTVIGITTGPRCFLVSDVTIRSELHPNPRHLSEQTKWSLVIVP